MTFRRMACKLAIPVVMLMVPGVSKASEPFITAEFRPMFSEWLAWRLRIFENGTVEQDIQAEPDPMKEPRWSTQKPPRLTPQKLARLRRVVVDTSFFDLAASYSCDFQIDELSFYHITDQDTLVLSIKQDDRTRRVQVYGAEHAAGLSDDDRVNPHQVEVRRFLNSRP